MRGRVLWGFVWGSIVVVAALAGYGGSKRPPLESAGAARPVEQVEPSGAPSPLDPRVQARLEEAIAAREYWASRSEQGVQAPNRAQNLRTWFEPTRVRVHDRTAAGSPRLVELSLDALGRGEARVDVEAGELTHHEARVEIARPELGLVEWLENSSSGLEQGFTLAARPLSTTASESRPDLVLELAVDGARARLQGDRVGLATQAGRRLDYGKLAVVDAQGRTLAARFEVPSEDRIRILVEDAEAIYPIVIDPLLTGAVDTLLESNSVGGRLGQRVASAGDVNGDGYEDVIATRANLLIGGSVFVYIHHGGPTGIASGGPEGAATVLTMTQSLTELRVASAGDVNRDGYDDVIVGSYQYDAGQGVFEGAAFIYLGGPSGVASGNESTAAARLEGDQANARFGWDVASAGDVNGDGYGDVIVGARAYDNVQDGEGAAFVFLGSASGISSGSPATAHARLESNQTGAGMGSSVASAGDVNGDGFSDVIVGAGLYDGGQLDEGAAFVFLGSALGIPNGDPATAHARLESDQVGGGTYADGAVVASVGDIDGDGFADVGLGLPGYGTAFGSKKGAVFVFKGSATGLVANGSPANAATSLVNATPGVHLFFPGHFGDSLAAGDLNGDGYSDLLVGAPSYSSGQDGEGVVFTYFGSASGIPSGGPESALLTLESDQASTADVEDVYLVGLGRTLGVADANGDGYGDLIAGLHNFTVDQANEGAVFVHHGGALGIWDGIPDSGGLFIDFDVDDVRYDFPLIDFAPAGDVNGDGFVDAIVGVPQYDGAQVDSGAVFIVHGSENGLKLAPLQDFADSQLSGDQLGEHFGASVASAGDVNGDGYGDVIIASLNRTAGQTGEGAAFVFLGSATGIASGDPASAHARLETDQVGAGVLHAAAAGDVNGDGYGDVVVSSSRFDSGSTDEGAAFVFLGSAVGIANGSPSTAHARFETDQTDAGFWIQSSSAGDLNGDGFGDLVVHTPYFDANENDEGVAFLLLGSPAGIADANPATAHARLETDQDNAGPSSQAGSPGDVNGDGYADLVLSAPSYSHGESQEGAVFVFHGSASGMTDGNPETSDSLVESNQPFQFLNATIRGSFDVNADGYADLLVQASDSAYVHLGSDAGISSGDPSTASSVVGSVSVVSGFAPGGDFNGDGHGDLLSIAFRFDELPIFGASYRDSFLGWVASNRSDPGGRSTLARQRRGDGSGILVSPGGSVHANAFVAELFARSPRGREYAKLEVEYCPGADAVFGEASCSIAVSPSWTDLGTSGAVLSQTIPGLVSETPYKWRARGRYATYQPTPPGAAVTGIAGPWYRVLGRPLETDFRTSVPEPGVGLALAFGGSLIAGLGRRRRRRARSAS